MTENVVGLDCQPSWASDARGLECAAEYGESSTEWGGACKRAARQAEGGARATAPVLGSHRGLLLLLGRDRE